MPDSNENELISIVIPFKKFNPYVIECVNGLASLSHPNFEVILLPDEPFDTENVPKLKQRLSVIPTGSVPPGTKRNIGTSHARGSIIAFIDDDAYPDRDWLKNAIRHFQNPEVAGVGGPNVTPPSDTIMQKAGGIVLQSWIGGGGLSHRYKARSPREDDDLPTVNLLLRKEILDRLGGFGIKYYPGDDTYLCLQITKHLGKKLIYSPDIIVYHHRHPLFVSHMKQVWNYGMHRGFFTKKFPGNSRRPLYFAPSFLVLSIVASPLLLLLPPISSQAFAILVSLYLLLALIEGLKTKSVRLATLVFLGIVATHFTYGIAFIKGLFSRELKR